MIVAEINLRKTSKVCENCLKNEQKKRFKGLYDNY